MFDNIAALQGLLNSLTSNVVELKEQTKVLNTKLGVLDKKKSDLMHVIEYLDLSGPDMMRTQKILKQVLKERREVKESLTLIQVIMTHIHKIQPYNGAEERRKTYLKESSDSFVKHIKVA